MFKQLIILGLGCATGGIARFGVSQWLHQWLGRTFPWGSLGVNLLGSLLMGVGFIIFVEKPLLSLALTHQLRLLLLVGLLGSFTTFSTFALETVNLLQNGRLLISLIYVLASVLLCIFMAYLGTVIAKSFY